MPAKPPKKRNPTDATLRNVRATAKRLTAVETTLNQTRRYVMRWLSQAEKRLKALEAAAVDAIYLEGRGKR